MFKICTFLFFKELPKKRRRTGETADPAPDPKEKERVPDPAEDADDDVADPDYVQPTKDDDSSQVRSIVDLCLFHDFSLSFFRGTTLGLADLVLQEHRQGQPAPASKRRRTKEGRGSSHQ